MNVGGRYMRVILISVFLLLTFRTFRFFPGMRVFYELWFVALALLLFVIYFRSIVFVRGRASPFEIYVVLMMLAIPILSAFAAWREFGQPVQFGLLTNRGAVLGGGALFLVYGCRQRIISLLDVEKALVFLAWVTLCVYLVIPALFDPYQFLDEYRSTFVSGYSYETAKFRFSVYFIVFGFYYYIFKGFRKKSVKNYLLATVFLLYLVLGAGGRSLLIAVLGSFAFFVWRWASLGRIVIYLPKAGLVTLLLLAMLFITNGDYMTTKLDKFEDAFTVVLTGEESLDGSANARIYETAIAIPFVSKHWLLGNGGISNQWNGGYEGVIGGYFYPSDIGLIGVLFNYGVLGTLLFAAQFAFAYGFSRKAARFGAEGALLDASKGFLLYVLLHSVVTGLFAHYSEISFLFIALLGCLVFEGRVRPMHSIHSLPIKPC